MHPETIASLAAEHRGDLDREAARRALAATARTHIDGPRSHALPRRMAISLAVPPIRLVHGSLVALAGVFGHVLVRLGEQGEAG